MNTDLVMFCNRLLSALINGGYQGLVLTVVVWLGMKLVPGANAATRHMAWLATLILVTALPVVHLALHGSEAKAYSDSVDLGGTTTPQPEEIAAESGKRFLPIPTGDSIFSTGTASFETYPPDEVEISKSEERLRYSEQEAPSRSVSATGSNSTPSAGGSQFEAADAGTTQSRTSFLPATPWNWRLLIPGLTSVVLIGLWTALAAWRLGKLAWQCCRLHSLKHRGTSAPEDLRTVFERLSGDMGMRRKTYLLTSPESAAPVAIGFYRPAVLFPARLLDGIEPLRLEQVLRHELAHVSRGDDWTNLFQQTVKAVLFFHPAVWWLSRRLTVEREIACDDHVLAATRTPRAYALLLTEFASRMQSRESAAALAAWSHKNQLEERITMILNPNRNNSPRLARVRAGLLTTAAAAVAILVLQAGPRLALAAEQKPTADPADVLIAQDAQNSVAVSAIAQSAVESSLEADDSGPRSKLQPAAQIAPIPAPAPHAAPRVIVAPTKVAVAPVPPSLADGSSRVAIAHSAPASSPRPRRSDDSIERRLERLEQLVESLLAREKGPKGRADAQHNFNLDLKIPKIEIDRDMHAKLAEDHAKLAEKLHGKHAEEQAKLAAKMHKFGPNEEELARIKERAVKDAARASRDIERAAKELAKADGEHHASKIEELRIQKDESRSSDRDTLRKQRQTLQAQRKTLEKQMEALEHQIQHLEEEQEKANEPRADREKKMKQLERKSDSVTSEDSDGKEKTKTKQ